MKYFGIGLSKTATSSLQRAFAILGFQAAHYLGELEYCNKMDIWDFFDDLPIPMRYKELDERFPNSKFIYTGRNVDDWLSSCEAHWDKKGHITNNNWPEYRMELFGQLHYDSDVFRKTYDEHKLEVLEYFKNRPDDLIIMDICAGDGWEMLCPFVGKAAPKVSFPHRNKTRS